MTCGLTARTLLGSMTAMCELEKFEKGGKLFTGDSLL